VRSSPRFFHCCPARLDPGQLLDEERQVTEPWGEREHGPCDKCGGEGTAAYECLSCVEAGARAGCPACQGRVRFRETCPACLGSGTIDHTARRGIAVFPRREGLLGYLARKGEAELDGRVLVEVEGPLSEERDLDADLGALLVRPRRIVSVAPLDPAAVKSTGRRR
jgi:hypothetical protein